MKKLSLGISDFKTLIEENKCFIDKSLFIKEIINDVYQTVLLPRPRRFGKTLNLSMLRYFFEKTDEDKTHLFDGLKIKNEAEFKEHFSKYPVIFLTFKDVKEKNFERAFEKIKSLIVAEFRRHSYLLEANILKKEEQEYFHNILFQKTKISGYSNSLLNLSKWLCEYHKKKVVILIDEYDSPIHTAYYENYYEDIISFFRGFLSAGLKDNTYLKKGVLTGILRVAKESIFSGLNNLGVYTVLDKNYSNCFGFTEKETFKVLEDYDRKKFKKSVKEWYDGYIFGDTKVYNPWSILNFTASYNKRFEPFWANTASNDIIQDLIKQSPQSVKKDFVKLLKNEPILKQIDDAIVFKELTSNETNVYSFLTFCGYLKPFDCVQIEDEFFYKLLIPNREVKLIFKNVIMNWFKGNFENEKLKNMLEALTSGDIELFEKYLSEFVLTTLSYFDTAGKNVEAVYQAFVLGLLVHLSPFYEIDSNKESGYGRYDISIIPKDKTKKAIIMELKTIDDFEEETKETALNSAITQIIEKKYDTEILKRGITDILQFGLVFDGKRVWTKVIEN